MIEKTVRMSLLFDFYGQLLTERQREFFALYYDNDLSLGEIAGQYGVSRQAVYDILRRSTHTLSELESKLELVKRYEDQRKAFQAIERDLALAEERLQGLSGTDEALERLVRVRKALRDLQDA